MRVKEWGNLSLRRLQVGGLRFLRLLLLLLVLRLSAVVQGLVGSSGGSGMEKGSLRRLQRTFLESSTCRAYGIIRM